MTKEYAIALANKQANDLLITLGSVDISPEYAALVDSIVCCLGHLRTKLGELELENARKG